MQGNVQLRLWIWPAAVAESARCGSVCDEASRISGGICVHVEMHSRVANMAPTTALTATLMDWLASVAVNHPASVAIAEAVEEHERNLTAPQVVARLRRGIELARVQRIFAECRDELTQSAESASPQSDVPKSDAQLRTATLVCEWQPVRFKGGLVHCSLDTSDEAEYRFAFAEALGKLQSNLHVLNNGRLTERVAEIAAAYPDVRDSLEELLWIHQK